MRIAHYQCEVLPGGFPANLETVLRGLQMAEDRGVQILSFPECGLTGYFDRETPAREHALEVDGPEIRHLLEKTARFSSTFVAGFQERRGADLYNTALVAERGRLLGTYSKAMAYMPFHKRGRGFPVFERDGVKFGVVICADGGYVEPSRILSKSNQVKPLDSSGQHRSVAAGANRTPVSWVKCQRVSEASGTGSGLPPWRCPSWN